MINFVCFDFDGVFTNGEVCFDENNTVTKKYNTKDGMGVKLLQKNNIKVGVISNFRHNKSTENICKHLGIEYVSIGQNINKVDVIQKWISTMNISLQNVAYMGDDLNDLQALTKVGLSGCPVNAIQECKQVCDFISTHDGGNGAVREFCEYILKKKLDVSALVCVKMESTRLPFKNIRQFGNTTLLEYKLNKLLKLPFLTQVVLNTESASIIEFIKTKIRHKKIQYVLRNPLYSRNSTENSEFCVEVLKNFPSEHVLYSPVTMPFVTTDTYSSMYDTYSKGVCDSVILAANGNQGGGHSDEKHSFCFAASLMKCSDVLKYKDFIGNAPFFQQCKSVERLDIDTEEEFNVALHHYFNTDSRYCLENNLDTIPLYNIKQMSDHGPGMIIPPPCKKTPKQVEIIDVTPRDGGFINNWNFEIEDVKKMLQTASDTGITYLK